MVSYWYVVWNSEWVGQRLIAAFILLALEIFQYGHQQIFVNIPMQTDHLHQICISRSLALNQALVESTKAWCVLPCMLTSMWNVPAQSRAAWLMAGFQIRVLTSMWEYWSWKYPASLQDQPVCLGFASALVGISYSLCKERDRAYGDIRESKEEKQDGTRSLGSRHISGIGPTLLFLSEVE